MKEFGKQKDITADHEKSITETVSRSRALSFKKPDTQTIPANTSLIVKEDSAKGSVSWSVYKAYAKACKYSSVGMFLLMAILSQSLSVFQNVFLSWWAHFNDQSQNLEKSNGYMWWLLAYGSIGISFSFTVVIQVIFVWVFCGIRAARQLHKEMLDNIAKYVLFKKKI